MVFGRAVFSQFFQMKSGWIPFVLGKTILRENNIQRCHFGVTRHFRQDRRGTDFRYAAIAFHHSLALTFVALPHYVRLTRAAVLVEVNRDYVTASRVAPAGAMRQMFINIFPNCLAPLIVQASLGFSNAILDMAALGFLGMGAQPPTPEWGTMLSDVLQFAQSAWWVVTFPGLAILLTVLAFNLMGDGLRDALDPKLKQ